MFTTGKKTTAAGSLRQSEADQSAGFTNQIITTAASRRGKAKSRAANVDRMTTTIAKRSCQSPAGGVRILASSHRASCAVVVFWTGPPWRPMESTMQIVSAEEKAQLEKRRQELFAYKVEVQERIRKAAALGDLSENAEYHFAKEENRNVERQIAELEAKLKNLSVVATDNLPEDVVFLGHTVKLLDLSDDSEMLVRIVGEVGGSAPDGDVTPVSASSPMGEALVKARVGDTVRVKAPGGTMEFKILEIV